MTAPCLLVPLLHHGSSQCLLRHSNRVDEHGSIWTWWWTQLQWPILLLRRVGQEKAGIFMVVHQETWLALEFWVFGLVDWMSARGGRRSGFCSWNFILTMWPHIDLTLGFFGCFLLCKHRIQLIFLVNVKCLWWWALSSACWRRGCTCGLSLGELFCWNMC